jgi:hypothetical protein
VRGAEDKTNPPAKSATERVVCGLIEPSLVSRIREEASSVFGCDGVAE